MEKTSKRVRELVLLEDRLSSVIRGKERAIRLAIATLLCRGNLLIEDVPGVGKTTLAFTLASAIDCSFQRIQFTSDLMPADIVGVSIYNKGSGEFEFKKGPIFSNIVLADEINRTTPKTQSALLEAMNEKRVSVERNTYVLPSPFMVIATQNPMEYRGTFPLPESQLDRFAMHLKLGYPGQRDEREAIMRGSTFDEIAAMGPVVTGDEILRLQSEVDDVSLDESILDYIMEIIVRSRENEKIRLGVSTRGAQFLVRAAKAMAYCDGRLFVTPGDVKNVAPQVLGHRIILKRQGVLGDADSLVSEILDSINVPL
ncbi:AAA family ATPase [Nitrospirota bacterium]